MSDRAKGLGIAVLAVLVLMPDTILFRLIRSDEWVLMFWRAGFQGLSLWTALILWRRARLVDDLRGLGRNGWGFALAMGIAGCCFTLAISWTTVANTLFIVATTPLWAAILSWLWMAERASRRTIWTIAVALIGIGVIAVSRDAGGVAHWSGDLAALGGAIGMAIGFTLARRAQGQSMVPALALATVLPVGLGALMGGAAMPLEGDLPILFLIGGVIAPVSFALLSTAPRYVPSPEVSLILLLETTFAPLLVWWIIGEHPGQGALIGGAIVISALLVSNIAGLRRAH